MATGAPKERPLSCALLCAEAAVLRGVGGILRRGHRVRVSHGTELCHRRVSLRRMQPSRCSRTSGNTCTQNDSIVLNLQSLQRGMGANLMYHTTRFDIRPGGCG